MNNWMWKPNGREVYLKNIMDPSLASFSGENLQTASSVSYHHMWDEEMGLSDVELKHQHSMTGIDIWKLFPLFWNHYAHIIYTIKRWTYKKTGRGHLYLLQLVSERNHFWSLVYVINSFSQEFLLFPKTYFKQERQGYEQKHTHTWN